MPFLKDPATQIDLIVGAVTALGAVAGHADWNLAFFAGEAQQRNRRPDDGRRHAQRWTRKKARPAPPRS